MEKTTKELTDAGLWCSSGPRSQEVAASNAAGSNFLVWLGIGTRALFWIQTKRIGVLPESATRGYGLARVKLEDAPLACCRQCDVGLSTPLQDSNSLQDLQSPRESQFGWWPVAG